MCGSLIPLTPKLLDCQVSTLLCGAWCRGAQRVTVDLRHHVNIKDAFERSEISGLELPKEECMMMDALTRHTLKNTTND